MSLRKGVLLSIRKPLYFSSQTDIKEATFLGANDELAAAGSDDGRVFIYNSESGEVINVLKADEEVANCLQPHPAAPILATSGIESVIRLWAPLVINSEPIHPLKWH